MRELNDKHADAMDLLRDNFPEYFAGPIRQLYADIAAGNEPEHPTPKKWSVKELLNHTFEAKSWILQGYLPVGLTILAGRPKAGKSWLALQFARMAAETGVKVQYFALEDSPRRLHERMLLQGFDENSTIDVDFDMPALSDGGLAWLEEQRLIHGYQLIIIDTFSRASNGLDDMQDMGEMTRLMGALQRIAIANDIAILLVDHHKKSSGMGANPIDDIIGSTGKAAVCDCALGLYKEQAKGGATLKITGRDVEERDETLSWDSQNSSWKFEGNTWQLRLDSEKGRVYEAIQSLAGEGKDATTTAISKLTGMHAPNVNNCLQVLTRDGLIYRGEKKGVSQPYYPAEVII